MMIRFAHWYSGRLVWCENDRVVSAVVVLVSLVLVSLVLVYLVLVSLVHVVVAATIVLDYVAASTCPVLSVFALGLLYPIHVSYPAYMKLVIFLPTTCLLVAFYR